jgi:hypothetical protein
MAGNYDISIDQGATYVLTITRNALNLTGYTMRMQGRSSHASSTIVLNSSTNVTITTAPATNSVITVTISAINTALLPAPSSGVYDLEAESPGGVVYRILEGAYSVSPEVTR